MTHDSVSKVTDYRPIPNARHENRAALSSPPQLLRCCTAGLVLPVVFVCVMTVVTVVESLHAVVHEDMA